MKRDHAKKGPRVEVLLEEFENDIDSLSSKELREEVEVEYGSVNRALASVNAVISHAVQSGNATTESDDLKSTEEGTSVFSLPLEKKRSILERVSEYFKEVDEPVTSAARNEKEFDSDIDSFLEDLIELGVIDHSGKILDRND